MASSSRGLSRTTAASALAVVAYTLLSFLVCENAIRDQVVAVEHYALDAFLSHQESPLSTSRRDFSTNATNNDTFSACLLTCDDQHYLIEWLAYHYHTLPLRHLIVAVDPFSKTSPTNILNRWRNQGMTIQEWSDDDFMPTLSKPRKKTTGLHRKRQRLFYDHCMRKLKQDGRKWVLMIDVDEYLAFNVHTEHRNTTVQTAGAVIPFLQEEQAKNDTKLQKGACVILPRLRYGSKESEVNVITRHVPQGFNASAFQTLRFRKHAPLESFVHNRRPKTIVDLTRINESDINVVDVHRPIKDVCPQAPKHSKGVLVPHSPLTVNHYVGTREQFLFRDDVRKDTGREQEKIFEQYKDLDFGEDDGVRPWLKGFVEDVGPEAAATLLEGVGVVAKG